jgi:hypothetical protein
MALSDLQVFQESAQTMMSEMQDQQIDKFNGASAGGIVLRSASHSGDFSDMAIWAKVDGLVRRRDAYGSGAVTPKNLNQLLDTSVKVATGTPPVNIDPGMLRWIQKAPEEAGATIGAQLAEDSLADMLNTGLKAYVAAVGNVAAVTFDGTAATATLAALNSGAGKFGDRSQSIVSWIMHSKVAFDVYGESLANSNRLFTFGNVRVMEDGFGRPFVITDAPELLTTGSPDNYHTCGLTSGAIVVDQNNDFDSNTQTKNGDENIARTYQAEWSYNVGLKGFAWDKANGGKSPNDTALGTAANWDKYATSHKDVAGVLVNTL